MKLKELIDDLIKQDDPDRIVYRGETVECLLGYHEWCDYPKTDGNLKYLTCHTCSKRKVIDYVPTAQFLKKLYERLKGTQHGHESGK